MDKVLYLVGLGFIFWCIGDAIVRIVRASVGSSKSGAKLSGLEADIADLEQDLEDARRRIEVLEKIVTDDRHDLRKQIDGL